MELYAVIRFIYCYITSSSRAGFFELNGLSVSSWNNKGRNIVCMCRKCALHLCICAWMHTRACVCVCVCLHMIFMYSTRRRRSAKKWTSCYVSTLHGLGANMLSCAGWLDMDTHTHTNTQTPTCTHAAGSSHSSLPLVEMERSAHTGIKWVNSPNRSVRACLYAACKCECIRSTCSTVVTGQPTGQKTARD